VYFQGNAPGSGTDTTVFAYDSGATAYYLPGTTGWSTNFDGLPTVLWNPTFQAGGFGPATNGFTFTIAGTTNIPITVESCTNLMSGVWVPMQTTNLAGGMLSFSDPNWTNYSACFYRAVGP